MTTKNRRLFALIPAAGRSQRMGSPKLLLPWDGSTVIERLVSDLRHAEIAAVLVVVRPGDKELQAALRRTSAVTVVPGHDPPDMRDSVELGLKAIRDNFSPNENDGWLLIPADHPLIEPEVLNGLISTWRDSKCQVLIPTFGERRGHPTLLSWQLAEQIERLPPDVGVNSLLRSRPQLVAEWPTTQESVLADLDTPEDYARWKERFAQLR